MQYPVDLLIIHKRVTPTEHPPHFLLKLYLMYTDRYFTPFTVGVVLNISVSLSLSLSLYNLPFLLKNVFNFTFFKSILYLQIYLLLLFLVSDVLLFLIIICTGLLGGLAFVTPALAIKTPSELCSVISVLEHSMETATGNNCIKCGKVVRARQHGILCEDCSRWQHRTCQTGITISDYRKAVSGKLEINWKCQDCSVQSINQSRVSISHLIPDAESTRLSVPAESILRDAFSDDHQLSFPVDDDEVEAVDAEMDVNDDSATSDTSDSDDDSATSDTSDSDDDSDTSDTSDSDDDSDTSDTSDSDDDSGTSESDDSDTPDSDDDSDTPESDDTSDTSDSDNEELLNSIHPAHVSFSVPQPVEESSVIDEEPDVSIHHDSQVTYELVEKSSQRMKDKLIDSLGYTYNVKRRRGTCVYWQCTVRNRVTNCKATVIEKNGSFRAGMHSHIHSSQPGSAAVHKVRADIKKMAAADHFRSAAVIAEEVLASQMTEEPLPTLPSVENLALCANRYRKKMRPPEPKDLEFVVDESYIPEEFYRGDVKVGNRRHLIFATNYQLDLLSLSKAWYVDATFNVVKAPFTQLFTVHSFIRKDGEAKQVPLIFVLMSGKSKHDYKKVMRKIKSLLPRHASVQKIVTDFEAAIWRGCCPILSNCVESSIEIHVTYIYILGASCVCELAGASRFGRDLHAYRWVRYCRPISQLAYTAVG